MAFKEVTRVMNIIVPWGMMLGTACMILIVGINGVPGRFMGPIFDIDVSGLSIPTDYFANMTIPVSRSGNITADDLQLSDKYSFYLWDYSTTNGSNTIFHQKGWDYIKNITVSEISVDGNITQIPDRYWSMENNLRHLIRFSQAFFLPAMLSTFAVLLFGVSGALGLPLSLSIVSLFTGIALVTTSALAGLITALIFSTKSDLQHLTTFGLIFTMGTSDLGVVWLATVHILAVAIMWLLMAVGIMQYNSVLRQPRKTRMPEQALLEGDGRI